MLAIKKKDHDQWKNREFSWSWSVNLKYLHSDGHVAIPLYPNRNWDTYPEAQNGEVGLSGRGKGCIGI